MSAVFSSLFSRASQATFSAYNALGSFFNLAGLPPVVPTALYPKVVDLSRYYDSAVLSNPDFLFTHFKSHFRQKVEPYGLKPFVYSFISSGHLDLLDAELQSYLDRCFPQLNFLLSEEGSSFIASHLPHLNPVDAQSFCESLSGYLNHLWEDLDSHINYEDKISEVYLKTRNQIAGLKSYLQSSIQNFKTDSADKPSPPELSSVARAVLNLTRKASSYTASHPFQAFVGGLALFGPRALAASTTAGNFGHQTELGRSLSTLPIAPPLNATVGQLFTTNVYSYYLCGFHPNSSLILVCLPSLMSFIDVSATYPQYPLVTWLSYFGPAAGEMLLQGTPKITDRFWQGFNFNVQEYTCPTPFSGSIANCPTLTPLGNLFSIWIPDTPPYIITSNTTIPYNNLTLGVQPCVGSTRNSVNQPFSCNFLQEGVGDKEGDASALGLYLPSTNHGPSAKGHAKPPSRITIDTVTGDISFVPTGGDEGRWFFDLFVYNTVWNGKQNVYDYNFNLVTWQSFFWTTSYIDIPNAAPLFSPLLSAKYSVNPGNTLSIGFAGVFKDPNSNALNYFLQTAGNATLPNLLIDSVRQLISFSPSVDQRTRDSGPYRITLTACNNPGSNCAEVEGCIPASPACTDAPAFDIEVPDNALSLNPNQPFPSASSTTIGTAITIANAKNLFASPDGDELSIASATQVDTNAPLSSGSIVATPTGPLTVQFQPGAQTGVPYSIKITATNNRGAYIFGIWTITLTPRPTQLKPGLPTNIASIPMQSPGSAVLPFPFTNPDLLPDTEISTLASQTTVMIPEALQPYLQVNFNNATGYNFNWTGIPGLPGTWPVVLTQTNPLTAQQISATTNLVINNAGPYQISPTVCTTGPVGSPVSCAVAANFGHLNAQAVLSFSAQPTNGLTLSNNGILSGLAPTGGTRLIPLTVIDDQGKSLFPPPSIAVITPYSDLQFLTLPHVSANIAQVKQINLADYVLDPDQSGYTVSFDIPEKLQNALTPTGTSLVVNAAMASQLQGDYLIPVHITKTALGSTYTKYLPVTLLNRPPIATVAQQTLSGKTQDDTFTQPYMTASSPDGNILTTRVSGLPSGCQAKDAEQQMACSNVLPGTYRIGFTFSDLFNATANSTLILQIAAVAATPWYLARAAAALPSILGTVIVIITPLVWSYIKDRRRDNAANQQFTVLPDIIRLVDARKKQIAAEKKTTVAQLKLPELSRPLGIKSLYGSSRSLLASVPVAFEQESDTEHKSGFDSPSLMSTPSPIKKRHQSSRSLASQLSTPHSPRARTPVTLTAEASSASTQASELSVTLMSQINAVTGDTGTIKVFQTSFSQYLNHVDRYHAEGGVNIANNCNLLLTAQCLAQRLNWLLSNAESYKTVASDACIDPHITMMVHWIKALYTRFVAYHSGLNNHEAMKLKDKRSLLQNLGELVKTTRNSLKHLDGQAFEEGLALYKELEDLRGAITSVRDEVTPSLMGSLLSPFKQRVDYGTAKLDFKALFPKTWFPYTFAIQELAPMAAIHPLTLDQLNQLVRQANGEKSERRTHNLEVNGHSIALQKISRAKDRGVINYFAADAYLGIMEYWITHQASIKSTDPRTPDESKYFEMLFQAVAQSFSRTLEDQIGEAKIQTIVHAKLIQTALRLLLAMPNKNMAAHTLMSLSPYFQDPRVKILITDFVNQPISGHKTTDHRAIFYALLEKQYRESPMTKAKEIRHWLDHAPSNTLGISTCRTKLPKTPQRLLPSTQRFGKLTQPSSVALTSRVFGRDTVVEVKDVVPTRSTSSIFAVSNPLTRPHQATVTRSRVRSSDEIPMGDARATRAAVIMMGAPKQEGSPPSSEDSTPPSPAEVLMLGVVSQ